MQLTPYSIEPEPGDKLFADSPDTCDPACVCSRCGQIIHSGQNIVRAHQGNFEFRYHARCLGFKSDETDCDCVPPRDASDIWTAEDESGEIERGILRKVIAGDDGMPLDCPACGTPLDGDHCVVCNPRDDIERKVSELIRLKNTVEQALQNAPALGPCCICQGTHGVVNVLMLNRKAPRPGAGCWGCFECGLPLAGAIAVLCHECFKAYSAGAQIKFACVGAPGRGERVPLETLTEHFDHNRALHPIAGKYSAN